MYLPTAPALGDAALPVQPLRPLAPAGGGGSTRDLLAALAGRTVTALVVGRADDGHGIIDIDGRQVTVAAANLPQPGASVTLKFAAAQAGQSAATAELVESEADAMPTSTAATGGSTLVKLGDSALSLGRFAETKLTPLQLGPVQADIEQTGDWSTALAQMLRDSGTFYESHLAAWAQGDYPLEDLRQEPQAGAYAPATPASQAAPQPTSQADARTALQLLPQNATPAVGLSALVQGLASAPAHAAAQAAATPTPMLPEQLQGVIREQLHALENQALPFGIEAWAGQRADLVISREDGDQAGTRGGPTAAGGWKTKLKLQLPQLGNIGATLTLQGDRLWLDLSAPAGSAADLDQSAAALSNAMLAAGIRLVRSRVHHDVDHAAA